MLEREPEGSETKKYYYYPGIRLEWGYHNQDNPDCYWNNEVAKRIKYNPQILAIDSLDPNKALFLPEEIPFYLPGPLAEINSIDTQIYVVMGDVINYSHYLNNPFIQLGYPQAQKYEGAEKEITKLFKKDWLLTKTSILAGETISATAIAFLVYYTTRWIANHPRLMSRREFLFKTGKVLALTIAGLGVLPSLSRVSALYAGTFTTNERIKDFFEKTADCFPPLIFENSLKGRTGILIAKTQDTVDFLKKPKSTPGAVILGNAHMFGAEDLLKNNRQRTSAVFEYVSTLLVTCHKIFDRFDIPYPLRIEACEKLLNYFETTEVLRIENLGLILGDPNIRPTKDSIHHAGIFSSPQVKEALDPLRSKNPH